MSNMELQLVCKIIKSGELKRVVEWGITEDDFLTLEAKGIFKQLLAIYQNPDTSGSVLGPLLAAERFSQLNLNQVDPHVTIEHLCLLVRNRRLAQILKESAEKAVQLADISVPEAIAELQRANATVMRLDAGKTTDIGIDVGFEETWTEYEKKKRGEYQSQFAWPWDPLQMETRGGQPDDYVVFYGRPKSMKSWVLCHVIAHLVMSESRVLVYTKEMTSTNIYNRIAACMAQIPYSDLRHGTLTQDQEEALQVWVEAAKSMALDNRLVVLSAKDAAGRDTVAWLKSKVERYAPTVVCIDGLYLMSPDNPKISKDNERVQNISRGIRQMILETKTPVIATMQANRKAAGHEGANLDEVAFSDAVSQDATMLVRVINDADGPTISLVFAGAREIKFSGMRIMGIPATNFSFYTMLTEKEVEKAKKGDDPEEIVKNKREPRTLGKQSAAERALKKQIEKSLDDALRNT